MLSIVAVIALPLNAQIMIDSMVIAQKGRDRGTIMNHKTGQDLNIKAFIRSVK